MSDAAIVAIVTLSIAALFQFFGRDTLWEWHKAGLRRKGIREESIERTPEWEWQQIFAGVYFLVFLLLFLFFTQ